MTAIHGLGAVGKSTLATALAYDGDVQSRFCDGILWVTLGQEPNILPMLGRWVENDLCAYQSSNHPHRFTP